MANFGDTFGKGQAVSGGNYKLLFYRDVEDSTILLMVIQTLIALGTMTYQLYLRKA
jgi:hypothetical protein